MKKKNLKNLLLNKKSVSNLTETSSINGGNIPPKTISCQPLGICCPTHDTLCPTNVGCGGPGQSALCGTNDAACIPTFSVALC